MGPNGKLFEAKLDVPRGGVERVEQGRASEQIGLGWNEQNKDNHRRA